MGAYTAVSELSKEKLAPRSKRASTCSNSVSAGPDVVIEPDMGQQDYLAVTWEQYTVIESNRHMC